MIFRPKHKKLLLAISITFLLGGIIFTLSNKTQPKIVAINNNKLTPPPVPEVSVFLAGDIMLSRNVGTKIFEANDNTLPFRNVADLAANADIAYANLESPFNNKGSRVTQGLVFKAEPNTVEGLKLAGLDVLATANNHAFDQGRTGITYTLDWLKQNGITPIGTGLNCHDGVVIEKENMKIGFLSYSYTAYNDGGKVPDPLVCDWTDQPQVAEDIQTLKPKVDFLFVTPHMGTEYMREPDEKNVILTHAAIDAGADMIVGHHPHWIQIHEIYKSKYIFYSLGNFVFDQMWSQDTREGLTLEVLFKNKELSKIKLMPVIIDDYCCPRFANEAETKTILQKINLTTSVVLDKN